MAISMLKIRRSLGRLIFNMGIAIPGKTVFLIETAPRIRNVVTQTTPGYHLHALLLFHQVFNIPHKVSRVTYEDVSKYLENWPDLAEHCRYIRKDALIYQIRDGKFEGHICSLKVSTAPARGLARLGTMPSAYTGLTYFGCVMHTWRYEES